MTSARILLVEDDDGIAAPLLAAFRAAGYDAARAADGAGAFADVAASAPDLVLLDLGLPDLDGVEVCRTVRALAPDCVIVILTARTTEADVLVALDAGADDYLTKPFRLAELLARVRAHLRRAGQREGEPSVLEVGGLRLDLDARTAAFGDAWIHLRPKEFDLLAELVRNAGTAVRREDLMARVWDEHWHGSSKTLDMHVSALRRRLHDAGAPDGLITTLRGHGYRCEAPTGPQDGRGTAGRHSQR